MKFGGTSVGSAQRMKDVVRLIEKEAPVFVVLSAMSGATNSLITISDHLAEEENGKAHEVADELRRKHLAVADELLAEAQADYRDETKSRVEGIFAEFAALLEHPHSEDLQKQIVSYGERLSTTLVDAYMRSKGLDSKLLDATEFMSTDSNGEPDSSKIKSGVEKTLHDNAGHSIYLTQGFICRNHQGQIDNLKRGGSDYSASLIGAAIGANEIQIWTDIDGMHNNDPRYVDNTSAVGELHFEEAAELAYFGAKILHPTCVQPAKAANIPVRLLNTMEPEAPGTIIYNAKPTQTIKAVAAKDGITAIKIKSSNMLLAYGFLRRVFEIFEKHHTAIDMITTSEVGVSVTIDNESKLDEIVAELQALGSVTVDRDMVIVCVVGDLEWQNRGFEAQVVNALKDIPVRMISYGGSNYNISLLIRKDDKIRALQSLSKYLFS